MIMRRILPLSILMLGVLGTLPARAQNPGAESAEATQKRVRALYERPAPPVAVPGAIASRGAAAPAARPSSELPPTEALFDAVNRGDIPAARDALSRGADLEAPNVLGLTAIDLAVDLGRNDMTFLLLSMRGAQPGARAPLAAQGAAGPVTASRAQPAGKPQPAAQPAPRVAVERPAPAEPRRPARLAGDPGTPAPQAGFLGFGSTTTR